MELLPEIVEDIVSFLYYTPQQTQVLSIMNGLYHRKYAARMNKIKEIVNLVLWWKHRHMYALRIKNGITQRFAANILLTDSFKDYMQMAAEIMDTCSHFENAKYYKKLLRISAKKHVISAGIYGEQKVILDAKLCPVYRSTLGRVKKIKARPNVAAVVF